MRLNDVEFSGQPPLDGYASGGFRIGGYAHRGGLLILPGRIAEWTFATPLTADCFARALAASDDIDLLLIGMGADIAPLPKSARAALEEAGIAPEVMATPAACRTFNVLIAEERRVGAALIPI